MNPPLCVRANASEPLIQQFVKYLARLALSRVLPTCAVNRWCTATHHAVWFYCGQGGLADAATRRSRPPSSPRSPAG